MKASIGGYVFSINPSSMSWSYDMNTSSTDTHGGRVIQLLSCSLGEISLQGYLPVAKGQDIYREMERFEQQMVALMDWQAETKKPLPFRFPVLDFYGDVYILRYGGVKYSVTTSAVTYTLQLGVDSGFDTVINEIRDDMARRSLSNIPDGINWVRNVYNTPSETGWNDALEALQTVLENAGNLSTLRLSDYYEMRFKIIQARDSGEFVDVEDGDFGDSEPQEDWVVGGVVGAVNALGNASSAVLGIFDINTASRRDRNRLRDERIESDVENWVNYLDETY